MVECTYSGHIYTLGGNSTLNEICAVICMLLIMLNFVTIEDITGI